MIDTPVVAQDKLSLWPSAAAELLNFAKVLDRSGSTITASQLRMSVQLANETYRNRNLEEVTAKTEAELTQRQNAEKPCLVS